MTRILAAFLLLVLSACAPPSDAPAPVESGPFSIILMIGDGAGLNQWAAARLVSEELSIDRFPVVGLVDTRSSDSWITDSAAGATAFSAGVRTYNGAIAMGPDTQAVPTVLELAESRGWSSGLVATAAITHATPAAFAAHVPSRNMYQEIAAQLAASDVDVLLGGGRRFFAAATRQDGQDLLGQLSGRATLVESADEFLALDLDTVASLVGFFADDHPGPATDRTPSLPQMTDAAVRVLEKDRQGFFLMVEGSQIDWRGHENAPLQELIPEVLDFDLAVGAALRFQESRPNTLIVVVADHETGGLALNTDSAGEFRAHYTTGSHTAGLVPLFARGPGSEHFGGVLANYRVGQLLLQLVREDGPRLAGPGRTEPYGDP